MRRRCALRSSRAPAALAVVAALGSAACADRGETAETPALAPVAEADRYGGTVVAAGTAPVVTFNPAATTDELSSQIQRHVLLVTLLQRDAELLPQPYLAESWELNGDSTQIVFRLRRDVRWHDGEATTARDVAFTFESLKDPDTGFPNRGWFDGWEGAEVLDPQTIRFVLQPHAGFLHGWTRLPILPAHLLDGVRPEELSRAAFGDDPVGNGPFRFVERRADDQWVFEANDDFPEALGGRPYIDRLVYRSIADETVLLAEVGAGAVHFARFIPPARIARVSSHPDAEVVTFPSRAYAFVAWNGQRPMFRDAAVRRALTMAIDRRALVDAVRSGLGVVANGPIGPWHWAYDETVAPLPYAPDSARALLERAGWRDADGDGVRERSGEPLRFELSTNERRENRDVAVIVQSQLARVGVQATPRTVESAALADAVTSPERRFDAFILAWEPDLEVDDRQLFSCARLGQIFQFASYCNSDLDPVLDSIPVVMDRTVRGDLYRRYVATVNQDQPFTFLYFQTDAAAVRRGLMLVEPDIRGDLAGVGGWWLHPEARRPGR